MHSGKPKALKKKNLRLRREKKQKKIVIDAGQGLIFSSEADLYAHFSPQITFLEKEYNALQEDSRDEVENLEELLDLTLDEPAEIWHDAKTFKDFPIFHFIRPVEDSNLFHVAVTYVSSEDEPTFIFLHFVTSRLDILDKYRRGDLVYDRAYEEVGFGMLEGDALSDGDPLAMGLFIAMLKLRSEKDVPYEKFSVLGGELREDTIEAADEIWRNADLSEGVRDTKDNHIVTFIKEFPDHELAGLHYIAVTQEDPSTHVHTLLFSFPTSDDSLLERYRHGENLQADEVVQESSH